VVSFDTLQLATPSKREEKDTIGPWLEKNEKIVIPKERRAKATDGQNGTNYLGSPTWNDYYFM